MKTSICITLLFISQIANSQAQTVLRIINQNGQPVESISQQAVNQNAISLAPDQNAQANNAFSFDGYSSYLSIASSSAANFDSSTFSICIWARFDPNLATTGNGYTIVQKGVSGTNESQYFVRYLKHKHQLQFITNDNTGNYVNHSLDVPAANFNDGMWHHIIATRAHDYIELVLDGTVLGSRRVKSVNINSSGQVIIGAQNAYNRKPIHNHFSGDVSMVEFLKGLAQFTEETGQCKVRYEDTVLTAVEEPFKFKPKLFQRGDVLVLLSEIPVDQVRLIDLKGQVLFDGLFAGDDLSQMRALRIEYPGILIAQIYSTKKSFKSLMIPVQGAIRALTFEN